MSQAIDSERLERLAARIARPVFARMLADFVDALIASRVAMEKAARDGAAVALRHEAHRLNGMAATFGASAVAQASAGIEAAVDEARITDAFAAVPALLVAIDDAAVAFNARYRETTTPPS